MNSRVFPDRDVRDFLSNVVCLRIKDGAKHPDEIAIHQRFKVKGYPTLVLLGPGGNEIYNKTGGLYAKQFTHQLGYGPYKAMFDALKKRDLATAGKHCYFLLTYFSDTKPIGVDAERIYAKYYGVEDFDAAYAKAKVDRETRIAKAKKELKKEREKKERVRRARLSAQARPLMEEANRIFKKTRYKSWQLYKQVILEYPETPEAEACREILRKYKKKWKEPAK
jgi:thioredoxin-related protein